MTMQASPHRGLRPEWWRETLRSPEIRKKLDEISQAVLRGELTLAEVGGFAREDLDSVCTGACQLLSKGMVSQALQIAGYLLILEPGNPRTRYLIGSCFHQLRDYAAAEEHYRVALTLGDDPVTMLCRGDVLLKLGRTEEGRDMIERGIERAPGDDPHITPHVRRARQLLLTNSEGVSQ